MIKLRVSDKLFRVYFLVISIIVLLIVGSILYFGIEVYSNFQIDSMTKDLIAQQQEKINEDKQNKLKALVESQNTQLQKQQQEIQTIKNKPAQVITTIPTSNTTNDLPSIIEKWRPSIAYVDCTFLLNGEPYIEQMGTGVLFNMFNPQTGTTFYKVMTNKHVTQWDYNGTKYNPSTCSVKFPDNKFSYSFINQKQYSNDESTWDLAANTYGFDVSFIYIKTPNDYIKITASQNNLWCGSPDLQGKIGDSLVILGYPAIGSKTDITATEGIISGIDGDYFITSAKVEHGNSGGAAISLRGNCFLGIPTWSDVGEAESLARILRVDIIKN